MITRAWFIIMLLICVTSCRTSKEVATHHEHTEHLTLRNFDSLTIYLAPELAQAFHTQVTGLEIASATTPPALVPVAAAARRAAIEEKTSVADSSSKRSHWDTPHIILDEPSFSHWFYIAGALILLTIAILSIRR